MHSAGSSSLRTSTKSWVMAVGNTLKEDISSDMQFVLFGNDWSSTIGYISERKSFAVPGWFVDYAKVAKNPENYVEDNKLAAIVSCGGAAPNLTHLDDRVALVDVWKFGEVAGCTVLSKSEVPNISELEVGTCKGELTSFQRSKRNGLDVVEFRGWTLADPSSSGLSSTLHMLSVSQSGKKPQYFDLLRIPHLEKNRLLDIPDQRHLGLSRVFLDIFPQGEYRADVIYQDGDNFKSCGFNKSFVL